MILQKFTPWPGHYQTTTFNESNRQQSTGALRNAEGTAGRLVCQLDGEETNDTLDLHVLKNAKSGSDVVVTVQKKKKKKVPSLTSELLATIATPQPSELRLTEPRCQRRMLLHVCLHQCVSQFQPLSQLFIKKSSFSNKQ